MCFVNDKDLNSIYNEIDKLENTLLFSYNKLKTDHIFRYKIEKVFYYILELKKICNQLEITQTKEETNKLLKNITDLALFIKNEANKFYISLINEKIDKNDVYVQ